MYSAILASAALLASTAVAAGTGSAYVINGCNYDVHLNNVPAADGGHTEIDNILSPNDTYTQEWTSLTNGDGWSIKLSPNSSLASIMQYEYTFHNDGIIWYDLSCVNGNPWDGNWQVTAEGDACSPKQQAYRYSTDDAYGMQSCDASANITVLLCSGESQNDGLAASVSAAASATSAVPTPTPSSTKPASATTTHTTPVAVAPSTSSTAAAVAPSTSSTAAAESHPTHTYGGGFTHTYAAKEQVEVSSSLSPTTLITSATAVETEPAGNVITEYATAVVTEYVTATYSPGKRHVHHPEHPNFRA